MQLGKYLKREKEKISCLSRGKRLEYIWQYYKLWIIGAVSGILLIIYLGVSIRNNGKDDRFFGLFVNTFAEIGENSEFWKGYVEYGNFDTKKENVIFNTNSYFDPKKENYSEYYSAFVAYVDSCALDVVTMTKEDLEALGSRGRLMDLSDTELAGNLAEKYADRLIYATPIDEEYSKEPIPIGIDLSDTCLMTKYHIYTDTCALGISALTSHIDAAELFVDYVINSSEQQQN